MLFLQMIIVFCLGDLKAQFVDLPDGPFKDLLIQRYPTCFNASFQMDISCPQIVSEDSLEFHDLRVVAPFFYLVNMEGIQYFTSLVYLDCSGNEISQSPALPASLRYLDFSNLVGSPGDGFLPVLPASLEYLDCSNDFLYSISLPASLKYLNCSNNALSSLPALPVSLDTLICNGQNSYTPNNNILTVLPALPATLRYLDCSDNALSSLPALPSGLTWLNCRFNNFHTTPELYEPSLASLPTLPSSLLYLDCSSNRLTDLPSLPSQLVYLDCSKNTFLSLVNQTDTLFYGINNLPALPATLIFLNCSDNRIGGALPLLPADLKDLTCSSNYFTELPSLPNSLAYFNCANNRINCLPRLPASMGGVSPYRLPGSVNFLFNNNNINCIPNNVSGIRPGNTAPLCTIINNSNGCVAYPVIAGTVYYDNNSNGVRESGELPRANIAVGLSNGLTGFTDSDGYYELSADLGTFTLTVDAPANYNAVPNSFTHTFSSYAEVATDMVALQPSVLFDSITVSIVPLNVPRPGFNMEYEILYQNVGTTTVSAQLVFNYDELRLNYITSSIAGVVNNLTDLLLSIPPVSPGQGGRFSTYFTVNPAALLSDTVIAKLEVTAGTNLAKDSNISVIRGSYDPNDKSATAALTAQQVIDGSYIDYLIRFQNTGTDTAFNIVITDTISSLLNPASLKISATSHPCIITLNGNIISFLFRNIQLPYIAIDEPASNGYIRFMIKPLPTAVNNLQVDNKASIYFDYNSAVLTNTASTLINFTLVPLKLISFSGKITSASTAMLNWATSNEINTEAFEIEESIDARHYFKVLTVASRGNGYNSYSGNVNLPSSAVIYCRLKMIDIDKGFSYSNVLTLKNSAAFESFTLLINPVKDYIQINVIDPLLVNSNAVIINETGAIVKKYQLKHSINRISIMDLPGGIYFINTNKGAKKILIRR